MATEYDESTWIQYKKSKTKAKENLMYDRLEAFENYCYNKDRSFYSNGDEVLTMSVSNCYIGRIIGKFGKKIREIQSRSGAIVRIEGDTTDFNENVEINLIGSRSSIKHAKNIIEGLILKWKPQVENQRKSEKKSKICGQRQEKQEEEQKMYNKFYCLTNIENNSFSLPKSNYHELDNVTLNLFQSASANNERGKVKMLSQTGQKAIDEEYFNSDNLIQWNKVVELEKWDASWVYETKHWNASIAEKVNKNLKLKQESSDAIAPAVRELDYDKTDSNLDCSHKRKCWNKNDKNNSEHFIVLHPDGNIILSNNVNKDIEEFPIENLNITWESKLKEIQNQDFSYELCSHNNTDSRRSDGGRSSKLSGGNTSSSYSELNELVEHEKWDAGWIYKSKNWNDKTNMTQGKKCSDIMENGSENLKNESQSGEFLDQNQAKNLFNWSGVVEEEKWDATWIHETEHWNTIIAEKESKYEKQGKSSSDTAPAVYNELDNDNSDCNLTCNDENQYWNEDDIKSNKNQSNNTQYFSFSLTDSVGNDLDQDLVDKNNDELLSVNSNDSWSSSENWENETEEIKNQNKSDLEEYFVHELGSQNSTASTSLDESQSSQLSDENQSNNNCNSSWSVENNSRLTNYFHHDIGLADIISPISNVNKNNDESPSVNTNDTESTSENGESKTEEIQNQNKSDLEEYFVHELGSQNSTASTYLDESQSSRLSDENQPNNNCNSNWSFENKSRLTNLILPISNVSKNIDKSPSVNTNDNWSASINEENRTEEIQNQSKTNLDDELSSRSSTNSSCLNESQSSKLSDENKSIDRNEDLKSYEDEHSNSAYFSFSLNESVDTTTSSAINVNSNNHESLDENCENQKNIFEDSRNNMHSCSSNESQFSKTLDENKSEKQFNWKEVINKEELYTEWQDKIDYCEARLVEYTKNYKCEELKESSNGGDKNVDLSLTGSVCQELDSGDRTILQNSNVDKNNRKSPNIYCNEHFENARRQVKYQLGCSKEEYLDYNFSSQSSSYSNHSNGGHQFSKRLEENKTNNLLLPKELTEHEKWVTEWIDVSENWKDDIAEGENVNKKEEKKFLDSVETVYMELGDAKADHKLKQSDEKEYWNENVEKSETAENLHLHMMKHICNKLEDDDEFAVQNENERKNNYECENWYYSWSQSESSDTDMDEMQSTSRNSDITNKRENSYLNINQSIKSLDENKLNNLFEGNEHKQENENWIIEIKENEDITKTAEKESIYCELDKTQSKCCDQDLQTESINKNNISSENQIETNDQQKPSSENIPNVSQFGCNSEKELLCENEDQEQKISDNVESDVCHELDYDNSTLKNPNLTVFKWSDLVEQEEKKIQIEKIVRSYFKKGIQTEYWKNKNKPSKNSTTQQTQFGVTNSIYQNFDMKKHSCPTSYENFMDYPAKSKWSKMEQEFNVDHEYELLVRSYQCKEWNNIIKECSNEILETVNKIQEEHFSSNKSKFSKLQTDFSSGLNNFLPENKASRTIQCYLAMDESCYDKWNNDSKNWNKTENKNNLTENVKTETNVSSSKSISLESTTDFTSHLINLNESDSGKILLETSSANKVQSNSNKINEEKLTADQEYELLDENNYCYDKWSSDGEDWNNPNDEAENKNNSIEMAKTEMNFNSTESISLKFAIDFQSNKNDSGKILPETSSANEIQSNWNKICEEKLTADQEYDLLDENNCSDKWSNSSEDWNNSKEDVENENNLIETAKTEMNFNSSESISPESTADFPSHLINLNESASRKIQPETSSANEDQSNWNKICEEILTADQEYDLLDENNCSDKCSSDSEDSNNPNEEVENKNNSTEMAKTEINFNSTESISPESTTDFPSHLMNSNENDSGKILPETSSPNEDQSNWNKICEEVLTADQECDLLDENNYSDKWSSDSEDSNNPSEEVENKSNSIEMVKTEMNFNSFESISSKSSTDFTSDVNEMYSEAILNENHREFKLMDENCYDKWCIDTEDWNSLSEEPENKNNSIENLTAQEDHFCLDKSCSPESTTDFTSCLINSNKIHFGKILTENTTPDNCEENLIADQKFEPIDENDMWSNDTEDLNNPSEETENNSTENLTTQEDHFNLYINMSPESATDFRSYFENFMKMHSGKVLPEPENTSTNAVQCIRDNISDENLIISDQESDQDENCYDRWSNDTEDWNNLSGKTENKNNSIENLTTQEEHLTSIKSISPESTTDFTLNLLNSNEKILNGNSPTNQVQCASSNLTDEETVKIESANNSVENLTTQDENFSLNKFISPESTTVSTACSINSNEVHSEKILNIDSPSNEGKCDWKDVIGEKLIIDQEYDDIEDCNNETVETENKTNSIENEASNEAHFSPIKFSSPYTKQVYEKFFGKPLNESTSMDTDQCDMNELMESNSSFDQEYKSFDDNLHEVWSNNTEDCSRKIMKTENKETHEAHFLQLDIDKCTAYLESLTKTSSGKTSTKTDEWNWNELLEETINNKRDCAAQFNEIKYSNKKILNSENKCEKETSLSFSNSFCPVLDIFENIFDENKTPSISCCDWNKMIKLDESPASRCTDKFSKDNESLNLDAKVMDAENKMNKDEVSIQPIMPNNDDIACGSCVTEEKICDNKKVNAELKSKQKNSKSGSTRARPAKRRKKKRYSRR